MDYEMEELVPIVGKLAEKYTSHESTSITYEKAEQLMGAVLYCIHELWESSGNAPSLNEKIPAQRAYEIGAEYVEKKQEKHWIYITGFCRNFVTMKINVCMILLLKGYQNFSSGMISNLNRKIQF